jgi:hypothetical protein
LDVNPAGAGWLMWLNNVQQDVWGVAVEDMYYITYLNRLLG